MEENPYQAPGDPGPTEPSPPPAEPEKASEYSLEYKIIFSLASAVTLALLGLLGLNIYMNLQ